MLTVIAILIALNLIAFVARASADHRKHDRYWHQYVWQEWLPAKWQRIARCETGIRWHWDSGTYVSAFGIYRPGYSQYAHEIGQLSWDETRSRRHRYPTPHEQFNVAMRIYGHFGYGAWGCGGA